MLRRLAIIIGVVSGLTTSCNKDSDDEPTPVVFKFNVDPKLRLNNDRAWVIVRSSESGELIDFKSVVSGQVLSFETNEPIPNDQIDVTYFLATLQNASYETVHSYIAHTYTQVDVGSEWTLEMAEETTSDYTSIGNYSFNVGGMPASSGLQNGPILSLTMSDKRGLLSGWDYGESGSMFADVMNIRRDAATQLISIDDGDGIPKYTFFENLKDDNHINLNYSDFKPFDKTLTVNFPQSVSASISVTGYDAYPSARLYYSGSTDGYVLYNNVVTGSSLDQTPSNLGFLDRLPVYIISLSTPDFQYSSVGPAPKSIDYIDASAFTITNESMSAFSFTTSQSFLYRRTLYSYTSLLNGHRTYLYLRYYAGAGMAKFHQPIPDELINELAIPVDKVEHGATEFFIKGRSYSDLLKSTRDYFGNPNDPSPPFEIASVSVLD